MPWIGGVGLLHFLKCFQADRVMWSFECGRLFGEVDERFLADYHRADFASPDVAVTFIGEADQVVDGIDGFSGLSTEQSGRKCFREIIQNGIQKEPAILVRDWYQRIIHCGQLGGFDQSIDGDFVEQNVFAFFSATVRIRSFPS